MADRIFINKKYKPYIDEWSNEKNILDFKAIENIEKYLDLGGYGKEIKILLAKLYKDIGNINKSRSILESMDLDRDVLIELFRINVMEGEKERAKNNILKLEQRYGEIKDIEEVAKEYVKWKEYSKLENLLNRSKKYIDRCKYLYYLYICCKKLKEMEKEIDLIWELRLEKEYEKEIKEEIIRLSRQGVDILGSYIYKVVELLCIYTQKDDTDSDTIRALSILLRKWIIAKEKKMKIIGILERYRKDSNKKRASNIFLNEIEILEKKTVLKSRPRFITAQLTTKCNLKCPICSVFKNNYTIRDEIYSFIKESIPFLEKVVWQGGECFLYDKFDELVELAAINGVKQSILTNGLLLNDKRIKLLSKYNIKIKISIDAVNKENYDKIRLGGNFENLLSILERLKAEKIRNKNFGYVMAVVVNSLNYNNLEEILAFAIKYGFECLTFQNFILNSVFEDKNLPLDFDKAKVVLEYIKSIKKLSDDKKLPIKVETNFSLNNTTDLLYSYNIMLSIRKNFEETRINGKYHLSYVIKETKNLKHTGKINNRYNKLMCLSSYAIDNKFVPLVSDCGLFCASPWTKLYFDINDVMRSACNGYEIDISKESTNLWNNTKLVEYRKNIVNNNIKDCKILCRSSGDYSYMTLLGVC